MERNGGFGYQFSKAKRLGFGRGVLSFPVSLESLLAQSLAYVVNTSLQLGNGGLRDGWATADSP